jgi:hypothetical protein
LKKGQRDEKDEKSLHSPCEYQLFIQTLIPQKHRRQNCKKEEYYKKLAGRVVSYKRDENVDDMPVRLMVF